MELQVLAQRTKADFPHELEIDRRGRPIREQKYGAKISWERTSGTRRSTPRLSEKAGIQEYQKFRPRKKKDWHAIKV
jgi:hypothetical protein